MNISDLYDQVVTETEAEKTASDVNADQGPEFNKEFFEKVAANDEDSVAVLNQFVEESRAEGYSDDDIEGAIVLAMTEAGVEQETDGDGEAGDGADGGSEDSFETAKAAQYMAGAEKALNDVLESEMAKKGGVTIEDLEQVELGESFGEGYAEMRQILDARVEKIAEHRAEQAKEAGEGRARQFVLSKIAKGNGDYGDDKNGKNGKNGKGDDKKALMMEMLKKHRKKGK